jgi:pyruvate/2-oxoglutarate dehydrogenase complex dihydrolipoamide dehydrogenase (E3) component
MSTDRYDAIVIGAGQGGVPLAKCLAVAGKMRTALIERAHVGGTCINEGCTPTKTMIASARIAYLARRSAAFGVTTGPVTVDILKIRQRKRDIVESWRSGGERRVRATPNLDLIEGDATFAAPATLVVRGQNGARRLEANKIFINAGTRPAAPPIDGLETVPVLTSTSIMELDVIPEHLIVVGGGYVGIEFAQMYRRFGSRVTIIQRESQLLRQEDADVAEELAGILRGEGVDVLLDTLPMRAALDAERRVCLTVRKMDIDRTIVGSHLLTATGRTPNSDTLNLQAAGVETNRAGYIKVNDRLETTAPGIWALGDINGGPAFTHISYDDFRIVRANLLQGRDARTSSRLIPYTVFTDPQLGRVGLTERDARALGYEIKVAKLPMAHIARAIETDETRGFMKAVVDSDTSRILGCAILGAEGGEIMGILQVAMAGGIPDQVLRDNIFAHPTLAEALNSLFLSWEPEPMDVVLPQASYSAVMEESSGAG